jgi:hypothetical protein
MNQALSLLLILCQGKGFGGVADINQIMGHPILIGLGWFGGTNVKLSIYLSGIGADHHTVEAFR